MYNKFYASGFHTVQGGKVRSKAKEGSHAIAENWVFIRIVLSTKGGNVKGTTQRTNQAPPDTLRESSSFWLIPTS